MSTEVDSIATNTSERRLTHTDLAGLFGATEREIEVFCGTVLGSSICPMRPTPQPSERR